MSSRTVIQSCKIISVRDMKYTTSAEMYTMEPMTVIVKVGETMRRKPIKICAEGSHVLTVLTVLTIPEKQWSGVISNTVIPNNIGTRSS